MKFMSLGGAPDEIGASCHYVEIDGTGLLLDTGADPEEEGFESVPDLALVPERMDGYVDHAVVTHAHHDHMGSLPVVLRRFPHVHVHMTDATRELSDLLLPASARLQRRKMLEGETDADPLFEEKDVEACSYLYFTHDLETPFDLTGLKGNTKVTGTFYDAEHVLGSVGVLLKWEEDGRKRTLFYTGDTGKTSQAVLPGAEYPEGPVDIMLLESTLAADPITETISRRDEEVRLGESIASVLDRGGTVLLPVFSLGRSQEILALIDRYKRSGLIEDDIPIYTAGMMRAISDIYDRTRFTTPRIDDEFKVYGVDQSRLPRSNSGLSDVLKKPGIIAVGSGMMFERTISNRIAQRLIEDEKNGVFLVGFARHDSPAHKLLDASLEGPDAEVELHPAKGPQPVRCAVDRFRFSGHSNRRQLLELVDRLRPKTIILVHGEPEARDWMADNIRYFHPDVDIWVPDRGEIITVK